MRLTSAIDEAVRNLTRAVTPWWFVLPAFVLLVGAPMMLGVASADRTVSRAQRNAAEGVNALRIDGPIRGPSCESVANTGRFTISGSQRTIEPRVLRLEPGSPVSALQITSGAAPFYGIQDPTSPGAHISVGLWRELGMPQAIEFDDGSVAAVAGTFAPPSYVSDFGRLIVEVVPATGHFDSCLIDRALALAGDVEALTRTVDGTSLDGVAVTQLNSEFGRPIDGRLELQQRSPLASMAAVGGAAVTAVVVVRLRRREIALQRQLGASGSTVALTHGAEAAVWSGLSGLLVVVVLVAWVTRSRPAQHANYLLALGIREVALGILTAVLVSAIAAGCVRRRSVLRYLRDFG